jgi:hypothetical protein
MMVKQRPIMGKGGNMDKVESLRALEKGDLDCGIISRDVKGWTGRQYMGRGTVLVERRPERFGAPSLKREAVVELTLHNGILNHMGIRPDRRPTPYWAVMDAMSDMKDGFTMEQVVSRAMMTLGDEGEAETLMEACRTAWYVLKSHQTHPKERYRGMSFIVETMAPGLFRVRARSTGETQEVFDRAREKRVASRKTSKSEKAVGVISGKSHEDPVVLATHVVHEVT